MKVLLYFLIFFVLRIPVSGQMDQNKRIIISSVNLFVETPCQIICDEFYSSFKSQMKTKEINSKDTLLILDSFLRKVKYSSKEEKIDARAKFIYTGSTVTDIVICIDRFDIVVNGRLVKHNSKFYKFLKGLLPPENISYPHWQKNE